MEGGEEAGGEARELARLLLRAARRAAGLGRPEHRFLALLAAANRFLEERGLGRLVIVGGFAVELLTGGATRTLDVDVAVESVEAARLLEEALRLLAGAGEAVESSRGPVVGLGGAEKSIDLVSSSYHARFPPLSVEVPGYGRVYVEAPEELVLRYLRERLYWGTVESWRRVLLLLGVLWDRMDLTRLAAEACREDERLHRLLLEALRLLAQRGLVPGEALQRAAGVCRAGRE